MRAILITADDVKEVTIPQADGLDDMVQLNAMREHIDCRMLCAAGVPDEDHGAWADDEGLFVEDNHIHVLKWFEQPIAGNILITGLNEDGETTGCTLDVDQVKNMVRRIR